MGVCSQASVNAEKEIEFAVRASLMLGGNSAAPPRWNVSELRKEAELLEQKAAKKKLIVSSSNGASSTSTGNSSSGGTGNNNDSSAIMGKKSGGFLEWIKKWRGKRKGSKLQALFDSLFPKLQNTTEEVRLWLVAVSEQKANAIQQGLALLQEMDATIDTHQEHLDYYDELTNDCLSLSYSMSKAMLEIKASMDFNEEIVTASVLRRRRSASAAAAAQLLAADRSFKAPSPTPAPAPGLVPSRWGKTGKSVVGSWAAAKEERSGGSDGGKKDGTKSAATHHVTFSLASNDISSDVDADKSTLSSSPPVSSSPLAEAHLSSSSSELDTTTKPLAEPLAAAVDDEDEVEEGAKTAEGEAVVEEEEDALLDEAHWDKQRIEAKRIALLSSSIPIHTLLASHNSSQTQQQQQQQQQQPQQQKWQSPPSIPSVQTLPLAEANTTAQLSITTHAAIQAPSSSTALTIHAQTTHGTVKESDTSLISVVQVNDDTHTTHTPSAAESELQQDEDHIFFTARLQHFTELKQSSTTLMAEIRALRDAEQSTVNRARRVRDDLKELCQGEGLGGWGSPVASVGVGVSGGLVGIGGGVGGRGRDLVLGPVRGSSVGSNSSSSSGGRGGGNTKKSFFKGFSFTFGSSSRENSTSRDGSGVSEHDSDGNTTTGSSNGNSSRSRGGSIGNGGGGGEALFFLGKKIDIDQGAKRNAHSFSFGNSKGGGNGSNNNGLPVEWGGWGDDEDSDSNHNGSSGGLVHSTSLTSLSSLSSSFSFRSPSSITTNGSSSSSNNNNNNNNHVKGGSVFESLSLLSLTYPNKQLSSSASMSSLSSEPPSPPPGKVWGEERGGGLSLGRGSPGGLQHGVSSALSAASSASSSIVASSHTHKTHTQTHAAAECVDDLRILMREEWEVRNKLATLAMLLTSTTDIGKQIEAKREGAPSPATGKQ